jgi:hypothetical protein
MENRFRLFSLAIGCALAACHGALVATAGGASVRTPLSLVKEVESYEVEVVATDRSGAPALVLPTARNLDTGEGIDFPLAVGSTRARLPRASYAVDAGFFGTDPDGSEHWVLMIQPRLDVTGPTTVTMDGRLTRPVAIHVPEPSARRVLEAVDMITVTGAGTFVSSAQHHGSVEEQDNFSFFYTAEIDASLPNSFQTVITSTWAEPGSVPGQRFADSPFVFHTLFFEDGGFVTGLDRSVDLEELAVIDERFAESSPEHDGAMAAIGFPDADGFFAGWGSTLRVRLPARRTAHFMAEGFVWFPIVNETSNGLSETSWSPLALIRLEPGPDRTDWNKGVLGPNLLFPEDPPPFITRRGDRIRLNTVTYYGDSDGHHGTSFTETGTARLFRDGTLIGEEASPGFASFQVPPEAGNYRLEVESNRGGSSPLSTQVTMAWNFRSQAPPTEASVALPVVALRFTPNLDDRNAAPRGRPFVIPFEVSRQLGATAARLESLRLEASFDGGQSWRRAIVLRFGDRGFALVFHPDRGSSVSLRANARDRDGNRVEQTILGAYRLRDDRKADQPR